MTRQEVSLAAADIVAPTRAHPAQSQLPRIADSRWHRNAYLALQKLRGRPVGRYVSYLQARERLDRASFEALVHRHLLNTLKFARENVPLYSSEQWRAALSAGHAEDLLSWPVLERSTVRSERQSLLARRILPGRFWRQSSQSSGAPVRVAINPQGAAWNWANEFRAMLWHGVPIGVKTLMLWRVDHPATDWVKNCHVFLTTNLARPRLDAAARFLLEKRPPLCAGLPSAVAQLARHVRATHPHAPPCLVPFVKVGGEQLYPFQREEITRHLGARVIQFYGCTEVGAIAAECPLGSLHLFAENVCVEILHEDQPVPRGVIGDIVITSLTNRAMPLVRYRVGDRGAVSSEPCACGLPHPVLTNLVGRTADVFPAVDGGRIHGSALGAGIGAVLASTPPGSLRNVRFEQVDPCHWKVLVENDGELQAGLAGQLQSVVRATFGERCRVQVERVPFIPREPSGKFRYYRRAVGDGERRE